MQIQLEFTLVKSDQYNMNSDWWLCGSSLKVNLALFMLGIHTK